jgi:glycerophosphoryl diester phosphodiesterase
MPLNIAHRGGAGLAPENTLAAFRDAIARGCDGAELDVQLSRDRAVVVHHDFRLMKDVARRDGTWLTAPGPRIKDLTLEELRRFDIGRPRPGSDYALCHPDLASADGERIPTLAEVIAAAKSASRPFLLLVELKCDLSEDSADPVALADAAMAGIAAARFLDRTIFVGFDWRALLRVKQKSPGARCWFSTDKLTGDVRPMLNAIKAAGGEGWFPNHRDLTAERAQEARALGLKLAAWTVNEESEMQRLAAPGIDAICTDRPDILSCLLGRNSGNSGDMILNP